MAEGSLKPVYEYQEDMFTRTLSTSSGGEGDNTKV